jgi:acid phosphatase
VDNTQRDQIDAAVEEYRGGRVTRRELLRRAALITGSMITAQALVGGVTATPVRAAVPPAGPPPRPPASLERIEHLIIIYLENWSFDGLYGRFPGANGVASAGAAARQVDKDGRPYTTITALDTRHSPPQPYAELPAQLPVAPFDLGPFIPPWHLTGDLVHRFYQEQHQIDGGRMDKFVAWSDSAGFTLSGYDATYLPVGDLARRFTLGDNLFHAAFGGTLLNSIWFIAARTPVFPNAPAELVVQLDAAGEMVRDGAVTPDGYMLNNLEPTGIVKRVQYPRPLRGGRLPKRYEYTLPRPLPEYALDWEQPSAYEPEYTLPLQTFPTIGERLNDAGVSWAWYGGGWHDAENGISEPGWYFSAPFPYFASYAPGTPGRARHLKDETQFPEDLANGNLPRVSYVKPGIPNFEHPEQSDLLSGETHVYNLVRDVMYSSYWNKCAIIITYDENGGRWDHVAPPVVDRWGPGSRVPLVVISPFAKRGYVDHTQYDSTSVLRLIETRWGLPPLSERDANANPLLGAFDF